MFNNLILDIAASLTVVVQGNIVEYFSPKNDGPVNYKLHDLYKDDIKIENKSEIYFQVKCEKQAYVLLQQHKNDYKNLAVEIVFGTADNMGISISDKMTQRYTWCRVPNLLSAYEFRPFWISWDDKIVHIGKGFKPNYNALSCKEMISIDVNYISIGIGGNIKAYWKIYNGKKDSHTNGKAEKDLTPVYVAVPLVTVITLLIVTAIILFRRYQRSHIHDKTKNEVVYNNIVASTSIPSSEMGIENPTYNEHIIEDQEVEEKSKNESYNSTDDNYSTIDAVREPGEKVNDCTNSQTDSSDKSNVYDKLSHTQGQNKDHDKGDNGSLNEDVNIHAYSHITSV